LLRYLKSLIYNSVAELRDLTYLDHFIEDNIEKYSQEVGTILSKLKVMGHSTGCESNLFEHNEGHGGDGVVCIKAGCFRLFCMYFRETLVICDSGGWKSPAIRAYQQDVELKSWATNERCSSKNK
jgi:hypothetical protein